VATDDDPEKKEELRAKDVVTRPREELEQVMDPAQLAQLASWFDMPNLADREEEAAIAESLDAEERARQEMLNRREKACEAVDPAMLARLEGRKDAQGVLSAFVLAPFVDESIVNIVVRAQLDRQSSEDPPPEMREYAQPHDIYEIVRKQSAPQAILRDLFRPVSEYSPQFVSPFSDVPDLDACKDAREVIRAEHKIELPEATFRIGALARAEGKTILREPWSAHLETIQALKKERGEL
jgi:hypothetical protein